jgi:hypothetical protein
MSFRDVVMVAAGVCVCMLHVLMMVLGACVHTGMSFRMCVVMADAGVCA